MKKFLSLVLALVMTMSLVTIGAGAKFTDDSTIKYAEAVDVISSAKIIDGYTDGSFNPTGKLTRGAAAKIICNMILGPTTAGSLGVDAKPFSDVATDNVFAGYIAYCSSQGIISGYADGTFRPAAPLTGYAFLKMLLGALGYDASVESFTGNNWTVQVAKLAANLGLTKGNAAFVGSNPITREEACLYALNTLKGTMVDYANKGNSITINGVVISQGASKAEAVASTVEKSKETIKKDGLVQFAERYFSDLKLTASTEDVYGRPASKWMNGTKTIGTYADTATLSYSKEVDAKTIYNDLSLTEASKASKTDADKSVETNVTLSKNDTVTKFGGNGIQTEVFMNDNDEISIVLVHTYADTVKSTTAAKNGDKAYVTLNGGLKYETEEFAKDDIVLYSKVGTEVKSMALAEVVKGVKVTQTSGSSFVADGTTYKYNADIASSSKDNVKLNSILDLYLDAYGYVIDTKVNKDSTASAYVLDAGKDSGRFSTELYAKLLLADGTTVEALVKNVGSADATEENVTALKGTIVEFSTNKDAEYTLTSYGDKAKKATSAAIEVKKGESKMTLGSDTYYANSKTIFLVQTGTTSKPVYTAYVGYAAVPSLKAASGATYAVYCESGSVASVVFVKGAVATSSNKDIVFVLGSKAATTVNDSDLGKYYEYPAVINGEVGTIKLNTTLSADTLYSAIVANTDNIVSETDSTDYSTTNTDDSYAIAKSKVGADPEKGTIKLGDTYYAVSDSVQVWKVSTKSSVSDKVEASVLGDIEKDMYATAVVKNGEIVSIFYYVSADGSVVTPGTDATIASVVLGTDKNVTLTLKAAVSPAKDTKYDVVVYKMLESTGAYVIAGNYTDALTVSSGATTGTYTATMAASGIYYVTVNGVASNTITVANIA